MAEDPSRFDSSLDESRKKSAFESGKAQIEEEREKFRKKIEKSPELPKLRRPGAWKAGWLLGPGDGYTSLKDLFARWYEAADQQHKMFAEQEEIIGKAEQDWSRLQKMKETDLHAKYAFASLCLEKLGSSAEEKFVAEARSDLQQAAEKDVVLAQSYLGQLYLTGKGGMEKSPVQAFSWLKKAADKGDSLAMALVAEMLAKGIGTTADQAAAAKYRAAVENSTHASALSILKK